jgi:hypothetical protein
VQLVTTQTGLFSGTVSFNTNDTEHNPCSFSVTGEVAEPVAVVMDGTLVLSSNGAPVEFGKAELGASGPTRTFTVSNSGSFTLETSGLSVPEGYSVIEPLSATIAPGASATVTVQLDTAAVGTFAGEVSFATNEPSHDPVTFNVTGLVVEYLSADSGWLDPSL